MRLLFDANLSPALVQALADVYPGSSHIFAHGDIAADDAAIWSLAARDGYLIATKDTDFLDLSLLRGGPPKVVLLGVGNVTTAKIEEILRLHADRLRQFAADPVEAVLIIDRHS